MRGETGLITDRYYLTQLKLIEVEPGLTGSVNLLSDFCQLG